MIVLTPEQSALVERLVAEGRYDLPDDVLKRAFDLLDEEIRSLDGEESQLLAMIEADRRQPPGESISAEEVFADARIKLAEAARRQAAE